MKKFRIFFVSLCACLCCAFITSSNAGAIAGANGTTSSLAPMLSRVMPGVVNVAVRGELPLMHLVVPGKDKDKKPQNIEVTPKFEEVGSGVIMDAEHGYIITNAHVVKDATVITITLSDGRRATAKAIGIDSLSDIAVVQIDAKHLTEIKFGDSDKVKIGDFVCAIGNPFGLQQTVTSGVVSGLGRSNLGIEGYEDFIQTDAPINPGNSGGALLNLQGELVGINTAIISPGKIGGSVGIGFAIPSNMAKSVMDQLIKYGKVSRGVVGVLVQDVTPSLADALKLAKADGALISQVIPGTPAATAGFKSRDVILSIAGKPIHSAAQVRNNVSLLRIGSKINVSVLRDNKVINLTATVTDPDSLKKDFLAANKRLLSGLVLKDFNQLLDNEQVKGVEVLYVSDSSLAYSSGLRAQDIVISAANKSVGSINDLQAIAAQNPKHLLVEVKRLAGRFFLVLEE